MFKNTKFDIPTETEEFVTETEKSQVTSKEVELKDGMIRLIGIPFFGIAIPHVTGLFGTLTMSDPRYWLGYVLFISLSGSIWQGNRYLLFRTRRRFTWFDRPIEKLILLFANNIFYTAPITVAWLCVWYRIAGFSIKWDTITVVALINIICVLFITHVYETVFMVKEQQNEQVKNSELQRAKAEAELAALKNQVDPHFMFNSLNTLTHLIQVDPSKALVFTENLADVYRYILAQKDRTLVLLDDELDFTNKYTDLLRLRFGEALKVEKRFNGSSGKEFLIPPTSVFVAFENAVKHNEISERVPMHIVLDLQSNMLQVTNTIRERRNVGHSSKIGLKNLDERFRLVTGNGITALREEETFVVNLPLIPIGR